MSTAIKRRRRRTGRGNSARICCTISLANYAWLKARSDGEAISMSSLFDEAVAYYRGKLQSESAPLPADEEPISL